MKHRLIVSDSDHSKRADIIISNHLDITRSSLKKNLPEKKILINSALKSLSTTCIAHDIIEFEFNEPKSIKPFPQKIPLDIIHEDNDLLAINKQIGLTVHQGSGAASETLVNAVMHHLKNWNNFDDPIRKGIIHRLDKNTSGVILIAKNQAILNSMQQQFQKRTVEKQYLALVHGVFKDNEFSINTPIGRHPVKRQQMAINGINAKNAQTSFEVIENYSNIASLIKAYPKTGRTHQIRVHLHSLGHSVIGDDVYTQKHNLKIKIPDHHLLHAEFISFIHPSTQKKVTITCNPPQIFLDIQNKLRSIS